MRIILLLLLCSVTCFSFAQDSDIPDYRSKKDNFSNVDGVEFDKVNEVLAGISMNRAKNGFSPRETAYFVLSLKEAVVPVLEKNISDARNLYTETVKFNKLVDTLGLITIETFIKGRERCRSLLPTVLIQRSEQVLNAGKVH